jgi:hypothetical protein
MKADLLYVYSINTTPLYQKIPYITTIITDAFNFCLQIQHDILVGNQFTTYYKNVLNNNHHHFQQKYSTISIIKFLLWENPTT